MDYQSSSSEEEFPSYKGFSLAIDQQKDISPSGKKPSDLVPGLHPGIVARNEVGVTGELGKYSARLLLPACSNHRIAPKWLATGEEAVKYQFMILSKRRQYQFIPA